MNVLKKSISVIMSIVLVLAILPIFPVSADGKTFKCAWFNETLTYPYEYSDDYFSCSPYEYDHELATFSLCVAMASFNSFDKEHGDEHIAAMLEDCGYEVRSYGYDTEDYDTLGVAFGRKLIDGKTVIIAAVRSGNYGMEWGGNLRVGSGTGDHEGFAICRDLFIGYLNRYFKDEPCDGAVKLLIPGYSRGASVANLSAAALDDGSYADIIKGENYIEKVDIEALYAYTFEAPQCTTNENAHDGLYDNIFNIINPNDYVPMFVMDEWGFTLYGKRIEMPCADNCENYGEYYDRACAEFDSFMRVNKRKAKDTFYSEEDSRSVEVTLNYVFKDLAEEVMQSREFYHENYEGSLVFFLGQYLGKQRKVKEAATGLGRIIAANAVSLSSSNMSTINKDGYRKYIADYISKRNGGEISQHDIEGTINVLAELLEYINVHQKDVMFICTQLNTFTEVHQPFVALTWMRTLTEDDVASLNGESDGGLRLSCTSVTLNCNVNGKLVARFEDKDGHVEWRSDDPEIVTVDDRGVIRTVGNGSTEITAVLFGGDGEELARRNVRVTVKKTPYDTMAEFYGKLFK